MATMTRKKLEKPVIEAGDTIALACELVPYDPKKKSKDLRPIFTVVAPPGDPSCVGTVRRALLGQVTIDVERNWLEDLEPEEVRVCPECGHENSLGASFCVGMVVYVDPDVVDQDDIDEDEDDAEEIGATHCNAALTGVGPTMTQARQVERTEAWQIIVPLKKALPGHVKKNKPAAEGGDAIGSGEEGRGEEERSENPAEENL